MAGELEKQRNLLMQFVSDASHELKTPIASLKALEEALADGGADVPEVRERFLGLMRKEIARMDNLVHALLCLQRGEGGLAPLRAATINTKQLVEEIVQSFAARTDVPIRVQIDPTHEMTADREKLQQVLSNLLENALRAVAKVNQPQVEILAGPNTLVVKDNGVGLPTDELEKVFDRFYRVDSDRDRESGGSGLGLAICKQIVEQHGGTIAAKNEGPGASFHIALPE